MAAFRLIIIFLFLACATQSPGQKPSAVRFEVTIRNLPADLKPAEQNIRENILAAAQMWADVIVAKPCSIEIDFSIRPWPARGFGRSSTAVALGGDKVNGKTVLEEGMAHELRTGEDPNGASPDVEMAFDPEYVKTMWWDPNPRSRTRPIPNDKLDAVSVIAHELGHAIAFNGRLDPKSGTPSGGEISPYDKCVAFDGTNFFFTGTATAKLYRKQVPLSKTQNNYHHFGEPGNRLDRKLKDDLMNGIFMEYGKRYAVTPLDIAVLADCGLEVKK